MSPVNSSEFSTKNLALICATPFCPRVPRAAVDRRALIFVIAGSDFIPWIFREVIHEHVLLDFLSAVV